MTCSFQKGRLKPAVTKTLQTVKLTIGRRAKWDVRDDFEVDRFALFFGGAEFPLSKSVHGVGVELLVDSFDELNAVDRAVFSNDGVKHDFAFDMFGG